MLHPSESLLAIPCIWNVLQFLTNWFSIVQLLSPVRFFATPQTAALQASLSITSSRSLLRLMYIKLVMPSKHLILCYPLLPLPSIGSFPMSQLIPACAFQEVS